MRCSTTTFCGHFSTDSTRLGPSGLGPYFDLMSLSHAVPRGGTTEETTMADHQLPLFYETYEDAIRDCVTALGGNKVVGSTLWPAMPADEAGRKLAHCLNPDKREKLDLGELRLIRRAARKAGVHILAHYEARDAGYTEPQPLNPEDEAAQLQREFIAAVKGLEALQGRMARLGGVAA
jgi:hypothetical protein